MHYMGAFNSGFITDTALGFPEGLVAGEDYDFFPFPTIDSAFAGGVTGDGNVAIMFNADDTTCSFMEHVATPAAQQIWVEAGGFLSVNNQVPNSAYPTEIDQRIAAVLGSTDAIFRFDLDDAQGSAPQAAVFAGVQEYLSGGNLDDILAEIAAAYE
jgi:alpha-glucoside transport system substrate-binding protein